MGRALLGFIPRDPGIFSSFLVRKPSFFPGVRLSAVPHPLVPWDSPVLGSGPLHRHGGLQHFSLLAIRTAQVQGPPPPQPSPCFQGKLCSAPVVAPTPVPLAFLLARSQHTRSVGGGPTQSLDPQFFPSLYTTWSSAHPFSLRLLLTPLKADHLPL